MEKFGIKKRDYGNQINDFSPLKNRGDMKHIALNGSNLEAHEILDLLPSKISGPQKGVLYQAIKEIKEYKNIYSIRDIIDAVGRSKSLNNPLQSVTSPLVAFDCTTETPGIASPYSSVISPMIVI